MAIALSPVVHKTYTYLFQSQSKSDFSNQFVVNAYLYRDLFALFLKVPLGGAAVLSRYS